VNLFDISHVVCCHLHVQSLAVYRQQLDEMSPWSCFFGRSKWYGTILIH